MKLMAWGGSLNKDGSDHIRRMREADKVIKFLEDLKNKISENQVKVIQNAIDVILDYFNEENMV